jgi:hypothetical protein
MADEQDAILRIDHRRLRAERQAARQAPAALQEVSDDASGQVGHSLGCATF